MLTRTYYPGISANIISHLVGAIDMRIYAAVHFPLEEGCLRLVTHILKLGPYGRFSETRGPKHARDAPQTGIAQNQARLGNSLVKSSQV